MKQCEGYPCLVLEEGKKIKVCTKQKNEEVVICCINGFLFVENIPLERIKDLKIEQEQVDILKKNNETKNYK